MVKYRLQEMPDMEGDSKKRVYPKLIVDHTLDTNSLIDMLQHYNRIVPKSQMIAVLEDLGWILAKALSEGKNIRLDGIGTFSVSLDFNDEKPKELLDDSDKMLYRKVGVKNINFKAAPDFVKAVRDQTKPEREMGGVKRRHKTMYTTDERISRALDIIKIKGFITLSEYADVNKLSRTKASTDLNKICSQENSPIKSTGKHSHKIWIKSETE